MHANKRVSVVAMAAGFCATVDDSNRATAMLNECIGQSEFWRSGTNDNMVCIDPSGHGRTPHAAC